MTDRIRQRIVTTAQRLWRDVRGRGERALASRWAPVVGIAVVALVVTVLTTMTIENLPEELEEGRIATRDIKADRNYEIIDEEATAAFREEAAKSVQSVYDFDDSIADQVAGRIEDAFMAARDELQERVRTRIKPGRAVQLGAEQEQELRSSFEEDLGVEFKDARWKAFLRDGFSERAALAVAYLARKAMEQPILAERPPADGDKDQTITIRRVKRLDSERIEEEEWPDKGVKDIPTVTTARESILGVRMRKDSFRDPEMPDAIRALAERMIVANLSLDRAETERRRALAAEGVKPSILKIKAGEMIIRNGSRYDRWHIKVLSGIQKEKRGGAFSKEFFGIWMLSILMVVIPFMLARGSLKRFVCSTSGYVLMAMVGLAVISIERLMMALLPTIREAFFTQVPSSSLNYVIPIAGGVMLIRMLLSAEVTVVFAVVLSLMTSLFMQTDLQFMTFALLSSFMGMITIARVDKRSHILRAGAILGAVNILLIVAIELMGMVSVTEALPMQGLVWSAFFGFLGGVGSSIFVMIAAPIVESVMDYTTDIKLLELANLNHPLLRELIVSAPGTYHHSHLVGVLGEAAAESIGANSLLVRVGAYYHDIGKMRKPPYFIENARNGENRHEKLTPHMSALIIQAHVKEGIELALAARLPRVIVDMIPQHHGTRMISFFYERAKELEDPDRQKIDPEDFRYPGPKPQTREAAILMLADVVEAQVRSLKEKSPARIEQTVRKIIDDVFRDAQLDECELTLKDLDDIHKAFVRILLGIYHQRIEYPDKDRGE